jgi:CRISPR/Cas system-associated exonuclease Cas4 (RecB family)
VVAGRLLAARCQYLERETDVPRSHPTNRASELGHPCLRFLVLQRTKGEHGERVDPSTQALFMEGRVHERTVRHVLEETGVKFEGTEASFPPNNYQLTGHVDALVLQALYQGSPEEEWTPVRPNLPDCLVRHVKVGVEIKSVNPFDYDRLRTWEDFRSSERVFARKWWCQAQLYMFLGDVEEWVFLLKNKQNGEWKTIVVPAVYEDIQALLDRAVEVNRHVKDGTLPSYTDDPSLCRRCRYFGKVCNPSLDYGAGAHVVTSEAIIEVLEEIDSTKRASSAHTAGLVKFREILEVLMSDQEKKTFIVGEFRVEAYRPMVGYLRYKFRRVGGSGPVKENEP